MTKTPTETITYAIGDVHGVALLLNHLLEAIRQDAEARGATPRYVFLGDLVDKGPESSVVMSMADEVIKENPGSLLLLGNHDLMFRDYMRGSLAPRETMWWKRNGLKSTLASYYVPEVLLDDPSEHVLDTAREHVIRNFPSHVDLLENARMSMELDGHWFVHAGIRPGIALNEQTEHDLMWIRGDFLDHSEDFGATVVHGHSPTESGLPEVYSNRVAVDTWAFATGRLTAAVIASGRSPEFISAFWNGQGVELERRRKDECVILRGVELFKATG